MHAIGVGESAEDMRPFLPEDYARSLMGLNRDEAAPVMEPVAEIPEPVIAPELEPEPVAELIEPEPEPVLSEPEEAEPHPEVLEQEPELLEDELETQPDPANEDKPTAEEQSAKPKRRLFGLRW